MSRLLREYFFLLSTKLFLKKKSISAYMSMSFCKSCRSFTSREWEPSLLQCHVTFWCMFVTVAPCCRAVCFDLVSEHGQKWMAHRRGFWANWKPVPGLLPRWAATLAFKRPDLFQLCFVIYCPNIPLFITKTEEKRKLPSRYWAGILSLSLTPFIAQLFMSLIWNLDT